MTFPARQSGKLTQTAEFDQKRSVIDHVYQLGKNFMNSLCHPPFSAHTLTIDQNKKYNFLPALSQSSLEEGAKVYMLVGSQGDGAIYYVGQTSKSITKRFYDGFREGNYGWAIANTKYTLLIWNLQDVFEGGIHLEAVEAELVFAARIAQRAWPKLQAGIYFRHIVDQKGYQIAPYLAILMIEQYYDNLQERRTTLSMNDIDIGQEKLSVSHQLKSLILPGT